MTDRAQPSPLYGLAIALADEPKEVSGGTKMLQQKAEDFKSKLDMINKLQWRNPEPRMYLVKTVQKFGLPDLIAPQVGGLACWEGKSLKGTPLCRFEIRDEAILSPQKHSMINFCYGYVRFEVLPKCSGDVQLLDPCINFDKQTKLLRVRTKDYASCVALLMISTALANCVVDLEVLIKKKRVEQALEMAQSNLELFTKQLEINLMYQLGNPIVKTRDEIPFYEQE